MRRCPSCVQAIHRGAAECPHCGFGLEAADGLFGTEKPEIGLVDDGAGLMRNAERRRVEKLLAGFGARFPQLAVAVHSASRVEGDLRAYAFWLLNRAHFIDLSPERSQRGIILLVLDAARHRATLAWGYLLDEDFDEPDSFEILSRAHAYWVEERYGEGIERVIEQLALVLIRRSRKARRRARRKGGAA